MSIYSGASALWLSTLTSVPQNEAAIKAEINSLFSATAQWSDVTANLTELNLNQADISILSVSDMATLMVNEANLNGVGIPFMYEGDLLPVNEQWGLGFASFNGAFSGFITKIGEAISYAKTSLHLQTTPSVIVAMDEPLFNAHYLQATDSLRAGNGQLGETPQWSIAQVASEVATQLAVAQSIIPNIQFGDTEPVPYVDPAGVAQFVADYQADTGQNLAFFQADICWGTPNWQVSLEQLSGILASSNIPFDIIIDGASGCGDTSATEWTDQALNSLVAIYEDPKISYSSLSVESWDANDPSQILSTQQTDTVNGTLSFVAHECAVIGSVAAAYETAYGRVANSYELYYSTQMVASNSISLSQLANDLANAVPWNALLTYEAGSNMPLAAANSCEEGKPVFVAGDSSVPDANVEAASFGLQLVNASSFVIPGTEMADLVGMGNPTSMGYAGFNTAADVGNLYLFGSLVTDCTWVDNYHSAANASTGARNVLLPDGIEAVINVVSPTGSGMTGAVFFGGSTADFVYLASGSDTYFVGSANERIIDATGTGSSRIVATAATAGATVIGDGGQAYLEITTGGTIALGNFDNNVLVRLDDPAVLELNSMSFITADASVGHSVVDIGAAGQTVLAGPFDTIDDMHKTGFILEGPIANMKGETILNFNASDMLDLTNVARVTSVSTIRYQDSVTLVVASGSATAHIALVGFTGHGVFDLGHDGSGHPLISYGGALS